MMDPTIIPAEHCYWVRLPAASRGWTRERILSAIEAWIPSDVDRLDFCWSIGSDGQALVLACEPERLDPLCGGNDPPWMVIPDRIPDHAATLGVVPESLNLLQGRRTPLRQRRLELTLCWVAGSCTSIIACVLVFGAFRHRSDIVRHAEAATATQAAAMRASIPTALGGIDADPLIRLDQAVRLTTGLDRATDGADGSAATALVSLLANWPSTIRSQVSNVVVDGNRCTVSGMTATVEDAQTVANAMSSAFSKLTGWRMLPLQATSSGTGVTFTCIAVRGDA